MMLVTQYLDVLKEFAQSGATQPPLSFSSPCSLQPHARWLTSLPLLLPAGRATMVVPHGPSAVSNVEQQVSQGFQQSLPVNPNSMI
eukprot:767305-Hanusia_phi.AAC.7